MSLNKKSVAAYFLLPQFHLSFQGMSHLYPVFMRVMALMFSQAGILPNNHPATRYGIAGVKKYGIGELLGEAWYNLRNRRGATPYQWGVFASIILMLGAFVGAIANFVFSVAFGVGSVAQAQLFSHPVIADTSIGFVQTADPGAGGVPFDKRIGTGAEDGNYIYNDYALIMLDKILRSSAATPQKGGSFQNGITALFQVYNTAITVIAAIMIFWIILSIVVDTAKTGTIGGGRHNMVWAPIRIVFALGLMIPLGTVGYSSGQYCVMKLAEWGSNLGTRGWNAYVTNVIGLQDLLAPVAPQNVSGLIDGMVSSQVCRVAYNTYVEQATGSTAACPACAPDPAVLIHAVNSPTSDRSGLQRNWTNKQDPNQCGGVILPMSPALSAAAGLGANGFSDTSRIITALAATSIGSQGYGAVIENARNASLNALSVPFVTALEPLALRFACAYVPHTMGANAGAGWAMVNTARNATGAGFLAGVNAYNAGGFGFGATSAGFRAPAPTMGAPGSLCGGTNTAAPCAPAAIGPPGPGPFPSKPTLSCHMAMNLLVTGVGGFIANAINNAAAILNGYLTGAGANSMIGNMLNKGWGGMGTFMNELAAVNMSHQGNGLPPISVIPGKIAAGASQCQQQYQGGTTACRLSGIDRQTALVMAQYQSWYETLATQAMLVNASAVALNFAAPPTPGGYGGTGDMLQEQAEQIEKPPGALKMAAWCLSGQCGKAMEAAIRSIFGLNNKRDYLWTNLVGGIADRTYPMVNMVTVGQKMAVTGAVVLGAATVFQTAVGAFIPGLGLAGSIIFDFARTMAYSMMTTGMMLTLYVPILPTIRVSFSVLTWMVCVFEAVVMVPIACLAHLTTEQEGLAGAAKGCWVMWLNVLTRPILSVFGFIGAFLIFNAWVVYFTDVFVLALMNAAAQTNIIMEIITKQFYSVIYVTLCYSTANACFKLMDQLPNALFKWLPFGGSGQEAYGDDSAAQAQTKEIAGKTAASVEGVVGSAVKQSQGYKDKMIREAAEHAAGVKKITG